MDVEAFLLCDAATDQLGKMNVLGAFDAIYAHKAPIVHPQFSVALRIRFSKSESANHPFRLNIINEDALLRFQAAAADQITIEARIGFFQTYDR